MSHSLLSYLSERHYGKEPEKGPIAPFITLSRETGCNATELAKELVKTFRKGQEQWHFVNKEILDKSAERLHLDKNKLEHDFIFAKGSALDDVVKALTLRYYKNDKKVRETIADIIRYEARLGHTIIVGRAGALVTNGMPGGMHVKLIAPFEWRVAEISKRKSLTTKEAEVFVRENDKKRNYFLEQFATGKQPDCCFDLVINRASYTGSQTVQLILDAMRVKGT
ncbi:MAG: cytidylate kinase-like family protein [Bacteroidales bacterium]|nr:cytidylate kinase-like family protein [Bacteroidales bacterium]